MSHTHGSSASGLALAELGGAQQRAPAGGSGARMEIARSGFERFWRPPRTPPPINMCLFLFLYIYIYYMCVLFFFVMANSPGGNTSLSWYRSFTWGSLTQFLQNIAKFADRWWFSFWLSLERERKEGSLKQRKRRDSLGCLVGSLQRGYPAPMPPFF